MDARLMTMGAAALAGLVAGGALWALSGGHAQGEAIEALDARLSQISTRSRGRPDRPSDALEQILALPLFAPPSPVAQGRADVAVQVFGLVRTPTRTGALLGVGGASGEWFALGETRRGVTLKSVSGAGAIIMTPVGEREVMLGAPSQVANVAPGEPPPGFKSPPPPASAPGMSQ